MKRPGMASARGGVLATRRARRGWLLLEAVLALSIFVMAGIAILSVVDRTLASLERSRHTKQAADLARSTMARLEAGLGTPQTLHGPVRDWMEDDEARGDIEAVRGSGDETQSLWEVRIETAPSEFQGLTRVTVHAFRLAAPRSDRFAASYTLVQLVRLGDAGEDDIGEDDPLLDGARRFGAVGGVGGAGRGAP